LAWTPGARERWSYSLLVGQSVGQPIDQDAELAVAADGTVYAVASLSDPAATSGMGVVALSPDGQLVWQLPVDGVPAPGFSIGVDGTLYTTSTPSVTDAQGHLAGYLHAVAPDGQVRWRLDLGGPLGEPAIGADGTIYVSSGQRLYAVRSDATMAWTYTYGGTSPDTSAGPSSFAIAIGSDGTLHTWAQGAVEAVSPVGARLWRAPFTGVTSTHELAVGVDGSVMYGEDGTGSIYALSPSDGSVRWSVPSNGHLGILGDPAAIMTPDLTTESLIERDVLGNAIWSSGAALIFAPCGLGDVQLATADAASLYVVTSAHTNHSEFTGDLTVIDRLGVVTPLIRYRANFAYTRITSRPVVASDSVMYLVTAPGVLHAIGP